MIERYVQLLCKYNPAHVAEFVDDLRTGDVRLEELLPAMEESGVVDAAVILLVRQGQVRTAMDRLIAHLGALQSGLVGILQSARQSPDSASTAEATTDLLESLDKYAHVGIWLCQSQSQTTKKSRPERNGTGSKVALDQPLSFNETLWLDLIEAVVRIASSVFALMRGQQGDDDELTQVAPGTSSSLGNSTAHLMSSVRTLVQQVFTALLSSTVKLGGAATSAERTDVTFLRILRAFLTRAASWSPSLLELRAVLASVFSAYTYEKSLLALANGMLDRDLFVHVEEVTRLRQRGWRPRGQVCEICRQRIWGPGMGSQYWEAWEKRQEGERQRRAIKRLEGRFDPATARGKGKAAAVGAVAGPSLHYDGHVQHDHQHREVVGAPETDEAFRNAEEKRIGPAVVFSCRHLYHQQCLVDTAEAGRASKRNSAHFAPDGTGSELSCPACT
jgi:hypothetical protein